MTGDRIEAVYSIVDDARRNRLITQTYTELSRRMRALIGPHASWCTFSTWSSRTVGYFIRGDIDPLLDYRLSRLPVWLRRIVRRRSGCSIGSVSGIAEAGGAAAPRAGQPRDLRRDRERVRRGSSTTFDDRTERDDDAMAADTGRRSCRRRQPSCSPRPTSTSCATGSRPTTKRCYEPDLRRQAELVLLGNILLADYEQQRVDPIVRSALSLFPSRLLDDDPDDPAARRARQEAVGAPGHGLVPNVRSTHVLVASSRSGAWRSSCPPARPLALQSELHPGRARPAEARRRMKPLYPSRLHELQRTPSSSTIWAGTTAPAGRYRRARAKNWTRVGDRMNCIVNVFRARQAKDVLYDGRTTDGRGAGGGRGHARTAPASDDRDRSSPTPISTDARRRADPVADAIVEDFVRVARRRRSALPRAAAHRAPSVGRCPSRAGPVGARRTSRTTRALPEWAERRAAAARAAVLPNVRRAHRERAVLCVAADELHGRRRRASAHAHDGAGLGHAPAARADGRDVAGRHGCERRT